MDTSFKDFLSDAVDDSIINWHHGVIINLPQCCRSLDDKQFWTIYFKICYAGHFMGIWDTSDKSIAQELIFIMARVMICSSTQKSCTSDLTVELFRVSAFLSFFSWIRCHLDNRLEFQCKTLNNHSKNLCKIYES